VREGADCKKMGFGKFKFTIQSVNKRGELKTEGGDEFEVLITSPTGEEVPNKVRVASSPIDDAITYLFFPQPSIATVHSNHPSIGER
jgi:hypothetical protein